MDALEAILTRRSIRSFSELEISEEMVHKTLEAAMSAPSAGNEQPWHFIVIKDRHTLDTIPRFHPYAHMLHKAPMAIVVCGDVEMEKHHGYWVQDCSAATENLLIAAHALGLGAVWLGIYPTVERIGAFRDLLDIPGHVIPFALVALGYSEDNPEPPRRFNPARIYRERWSDRS